MTIMQEDGQGQGENGIAEVTATNSNATGGGQDHELENEELKEMLEILDLALEDKKQVITELEETRRVMSTDLKESYTTSDALQQVCNCLQVQVDVLENKNSLLQEKYSGLEFDLKGIKLNQQQQKKDNEADVDGAAEKNSGNEAMEQQDEKLVKDRDEAFEMLKQVGDECEEVTKKYQECKQVQVTLEMRIKELESKTNSISSPSTPIIIAVGVNEASGFPNPTSSTKINPKTAVGLNDEEDGDTMNVDQDEEDIENAIKNNLDGVEKITQLNTALQETQNRYNLAEKEVLDLKNKLQERDAELMLEIQNKCKLSSKNNNSIKKSANSTPLSGIKNRNNIAATASSIQIDTSMFETDEELLEVLQSKVDEVETLEDELESKQIELSVKNAQLSKFQENIQKANAEREDLGKNLKESQDSYTRLEKEKLESDTELRVLKVKYETMEKDFISMGLEKDKLEDDKKIMDEIIVDSNQQKSQLELSIKDIHEKMQAYKKVTMDEKTQMEGDVKELRHTYQNLMSKNGNLKRERDTLKDNVKSMLEDFQIELKDKTECLDREYTGKLAALESKLLETEKAFSLTIKEKNECAGGLKKKLDSLKMELQSEVGKFTVCNDKLTQAMSHLEILEKEINTSAELYQEERAKATKLQTKLGQIDEEIRQLRSDNEEFNAKNTQLQDDKKCIDDINKELKTQLEDLNAKNEDMVVQQLQLKDGEIGKLNNELVELKTRYEADAKENQNHNCLLETDLKDKNEQIEIQTNLIKELELQGQQIKSEHKLQVDNVTDQLNVKSRLYENILIEKSQLALKLETVDVEVGAKTAGFDEEKNILIFERKQVEERLQKHDVEFFKVIKRNEKLERDIKMLKSKMTRIKKEAMNNKSNKKPSNNIANNPNDKENKQPTEQSSLKKRPPINNPITLGSYPSLHNTLDRSSFPRDDNLAAAAAAVMNKRTNNEHTNVNDDSGGKKLLLTTRGASEYSGDMQYGTRETPAKRAMSFFGNLQGGGENKSDKN